MGLLSVLLESVHYLKCLRLLGAEMVGSGCKTVIRQFESPAS